MTVNRVSFGGPPVLVVNVGHVRDWPGSIVEVVSRVADKGLCLRLGGSLVLVVNGVVVGGVVTVDGRGFGGPLMSVVHVRGVGMWVWGVGVVVERDGPVAGFRLGYGVSRSLVEVV